jgi:hypothetical protein
MAAMRKEWHQVARVGGVVVVALILSSCLNAARYYGKDSRLGDWRISVSLESVPLPNGNDTGGHDYYSLTVSMTTGEYPRSSDFRIDSLVIVDADTTVLANSIFQWHSDVSEPGNAPLLNKLFETRSPIPPRMIHRGYYTYLDKLGGSKALTIDHELKLRPKRFHSDA